MAKSLYKTRNTGQPICFPAGSYLERTTRPIYALLFLLPFIAFYELGTLFINAETLSRLQGRVIAFMWLHNFAGYLGLTARFAWLAAPLIVAVIILALQITSRKSWSVRPPDFAVMAAECVLLAVPLIVLGMLFNRPAPADDAGASPPPAAAGIHQTQNPHAETSPFAAPAQEIENDETDLLANIVTGIGAGIYEEFIFRLVLICLFMLLLQDVLAIPLNISIILAVLASALLFSAHHHIFFLNGHLESGESFAWPPFIFRTTAGVYFAALFAIRGFGITAGAHAFYDIIAALLNAALFTTGQSPA